jgi:hypothetical protein
VGSGKLSHDTSQYVQTSLKVGLDSRGRSGQNLGKLNFPEPVEGMNRTADILNCVRAGGIVSVRSGGSLIKKGRQRGFAKRICPWEPSGSETATNHQQQGNLVLSVHFDLVGWKAVVASLIPKRRNV